MTQRALNLTHGNTFSARPTQEAGQLFFGGTYMYLCSYLVVSF